MRDLTDPNRSVKTGRAAKIIGITPVTLRTWAKRGLIPHYFTPTNQLRIDLVAYFEQRNAIIARQQAELSMQSVKARPNGSKATVTLG